MPFVPQFGGYLRKDPLGPSTVNQLAANIVALDELERAHHFADGQHNALEVPWVLGHVDGTTGYIFDTNFGGGTINNPATGTYELDIAPDVAPDGQWFSILANVNDEAIDAKPHIITVEKPTDLLMRTRIRALSSSLGSGNSWASVNRDFDIALHAPPQSVDDSALDLFQQKVRRDFLTEAATDWNAIAKNQARVRKAMSLEHRGDGTHNVNRIARAASWIRPTPGPGYTETYGEGVASVTRNGTGIITVETSVEFASMAQMACFPSVQASSADEMAIIHGRALTTTTFRFFIYVFSGGNWARGDRSFFSSFFGVPK